MYRNEDAVSKRPKYGPIAHLKWTNTTKRNYILKQDKIEKSVNASKVPINSTFKGRKIVRGGKTEEGT